MLARFTRWRISFGAKAAYAIKTVADVYRENVPISTLGLLPGPFAKCMGNSLLINRGAREYTERPLTLVLSLGSPSAKYIPVR